MENVLDPLDASLNIHLSGPKNAICATNSEGVLAYAFGGVRCPLSITFGKFCFSCVILDSTEVSARDTEHLRTSCIARIGVSQRCTDVGRLGEVKAAEGISVGYHSTGKKVCGSNLERYGDSFGPGDRVTVLVDLTGSNSSSGSDPHTNMGHVSYAKNGVWQGAAHSIPLSQSQEEGLHPHMLLRNCVASIQIHTPFEIPGTVPSPANPYGVSIDQYANWSSAFTQGHGINAAEPWPPISSPEVIMMVGLPGSGKTKWAQSYMKCKDNVKARYMLLGPEPVLDQMRLLGLRKVARAATDTQDGSLVLESYLGVATAALNQLLARAIEVPRNYILDQTNVSSAKRAARLAPFRAAGFKVMGALAAPPLRWLHIQQDSCGGNAPSTWSTRIKLENSWQECGMRLMPEQVMAELMATFETPFPGGPEGFTDVMLVHPLPPHKESQRLIQAPIKEQLQHVNAIAVEPQREMGQRWLEQNRGQNCSQQQQKDEYPQHSQHPNPKPRPLTAQSLSSLLQCAAANGPQGIDDFIQAASAIGINLQEQLTADMLKLPMEMQQICLNALVKQQQQEQQQPPFQPEASHTPPLLHHPQQTHAPSLQHPLQQSMPQLPSFHHPQPSFQQGPTQLQPPFQQLHLPEMPQSIPPYHSHLLQGSTQHPHLPQQQNFPVRPMPSTMGPDMGPIPPGLMPSISMPQMSVPPAGQVPPLMPPMGQLPRPMPPFPAFPGWS